MPKAIIRRQRQQNQQLQEFFNAVIKSNATKVRDLVTQGLDINSFNEDGKTALYFANNPQQKHPVIKKIL